MAVEKPVCATVDLRYTTSVFGPGKCATYSAVCCIFRKRPSCIPSAMPGKDMAGTPRHGAGKGSSGYGWAEDEASVEPASSLCSRSLVGMVCSTAKRATGADLGLLHIKAKLNSGKGLFYPASIQSHGRSTPYLGISLRGTRPIKCRDSMGRL